MQGDVLGPLVSSNMVDKNIGRAAIETENIYMYKGKVEIPPLTMQDDTLSISECGYKTNKMNTFLNTHTKLMNLQFGSEKCSKMHIGKHMNRDICPQLSVEAWENKIVQYQGTNILKDTYIGNIFMQTLSEKKYLGDIISDNGTNKANIRERTNRATGTVNKILTILCERPYGKHYFKAAKLMREAMLVNGMLGNSESWINITKQDIEDLDKPDTILKRKILSLSGNPSKCFMFLELGILPVKYVIMKKRMQFLHYILNENIDSMIVQVYNALKEDHKKGDFVQLTNLDRKDLDIELTDEDIQTIPKVTWKKYIKEKVNTLALEELNYQNSGKEKTKNIVFSQIKMSKYLEKNENTELSKLIFSVRSGTLDVKEWLPWNYADNICIACKKCEETMNHLMVCDSYKNEACVDWKNVFDDKLDDIFIIGKQIQKRHRERKRLLESEAGQALDPDSTAPGDS